MILVFHIPSPLCAYLFLEVSVNATCSLRWLLNPVIVAQTYGVMKAHKAKLLRHYQTVITLWKRVCIFSAAYPLIELLILTHADCLFSVYSRDASTLLRMHVENKSGLQARNWKSLWGTWQCCASCAGGRFGRGLTVRWNGEANDLPWKGCKRVSPLLPYASFPHSCIMFCNPFTSIKQESQF